MNIKLYLDNIVDTTGPEEIEIRQDTSDKIELTISYNISREELFISHFYVHKNYRRNNYGTKMYKKLYNYAVNNEHINHFRFHIKKTPESTKWIQNMNEEYIETKVGSVGTVFEINYRV